MIGKRNQNKKLHNITKQLPVQECHSKYWAIDFQIIASSTADTLSLDTVPIEPFLSIKDYYTGDMVNNSNTYNY